MGRRPKQTPKKAYRCQQTRENSKSLIIKVMHIKTAMRYHFTPWPSSKIYKQ